MAPQSKPGVARRSYGTTADGTSVELFTLAAGGLEADIATYGGTVTALRVPDRNGEPGDVVLGHASLDGYLAASPYFGALIGRFGNRIAGGRFTLDGEAHQLACNDGANHLHGGLRGFDKRVFVARPWADGERAALSLSLASPDGDEGYPGRLEVEVAYALTLAGELTIDYRATTDRRTVLNLTHHGYWNLDGEGSGDVLAHRLELHAGRFTPGREGLIPTGELAKVEGTPFDFRAPHAIGERIGAPDPQLAVAGGYDHNFVLDRSGSGLVPAARLEAARSGRVMEVLTTEPGIQFYSGNFLDGTIAGKCGHVYHHRTGLCLETQHFPDSPNQPTFPSTVLSPGETYRSSTVYRFSLAR